MTACRSVFGEFDLNDYHPLIQEDQLQVIQWDKSCWHLHCGHLIAALCLSRLKPVFVACVCTPEFLRAKYIIQLWLLCQRRWCGTSYDPVTKLFIPHAPCEACCSKTPNIHLLKYYVMQLDWMIQKYLSKMKSTITVFLIISDCLQLSPHPIKFLVCNWNPSQGGHNPMTMTRINPLTCLPMRKRRMMIMMRRWRVTLILMWRMFLNLLTTFRWKNLRETPFDWIKASHVDLLIDFVCVVFLLSHNPIVQECVIKNHIQTDKDEVKHLIVKLLIPEDVLRIKQSCLMASFVPMLWKEWGEQLPLFVWIV